MRTLRLLLVTVALTVTAAAAPSAPPVGAASPASPVSATAPMPPGTDNPFIPPEANLGDCVSALPRPGCGSEARGGSGQWLVFGALVLGLGFIGWRVVRSARRARPTPDG